MYDKYRPIERIVYKNPTIDKSIFPTIDEDKLKLQERGCERINFRYQNVCYLYFNEIGTKWYIDIYYYYETMCDHQLFMKRFVICSGFQMEEEDEREFIYLLKNERLDFIDIDLHEFVNKINELDPSIKMENYYDPGKMLYHTYFASFNSGIREKMFKAGGLYNIAWNLNDIEGWNIVATNIEEAFGIPIKMLRKMNDTLTVNSMHWLDTNEGRRKVASIYENYHQLLNTHNEICELQLFYLDDCSMKNKPVNLNTMRYFPKLNYIFDDEEERFIEPPEIWRIINEYKYMVDIELAKDLHFLIDEESNFYWHYKLIKYLELHKDNIDELQKKYVDRCKKYIFEDEKYMISIPVSVDDFLEEARYQQNCLIKYVKLALEGDTDIVFLRNKVNSKTPLVTIEICGNVIRQAKGRFNADITPDEGVFLATFAKEKGLTN